MSASRVASSTASTVERATIVGLAFSGRRRDAVESSLEELAGLAVTAGATVVPRLIQVRSKPNPAFFLGRGKVDNLALECAETGVELAIFDDELTTGRLRNLEGRLGRRVIDRRTSSSTSSRRGHGLGWASYRSSWSSSGICCRGSSVWARRSHGSAPGSGRGGRARPSWKRTAGGSDSGSHG